MYSFTFSFQDYEFLSVFVSNYDKILNHFKDFKDSKAVKFLKTKG